MRKREMELMGGGAPTRGRLSQCSVRCDMGGSEGTDSSSPSRDSVGVYGCEGVSRNLQLRRWPDSSSGSL